MAKIFKTTSVLGGGCVVLEQKNIYLKVLTCFSLSLSLSVPLWHSQATCNPVNISCFDSSIMHICSNFSNKCFTQLVLPFEEI